eukprot:gnl/Spiro4/5233_TR2640_c0_g1_i1.p1 gnl/Spiro4/5233_TR2640_c0_g1~~gnl/Spiro4/5233_TR2640_c0_g1_i1.p1  ORF type:complete len:556 (+),score=51.24 gnl/Spiro4/5233_TR2640_c0_g1_i1:131-1798(+)
MHLSLRYCFSILHRRGFSTSSTQPNTPQRASPFGLRALNVFPAGSQSGQFDLPPERALVIERSSGAQLWTPEGEMLVDMCMGGGSVLVGHSRPEVYDAAVQQLKLGGNYSYNNKAAVLLAEELQDAIKMLERLRFCSSGDEAIMFCTRIARAYTGKRKILKFEGGYHGNSDLGVTSAFPHNQIEFPFPSPSSGGIYTGNVLVAPFNDLRTTTQIVRESLPDLAAIIVEPLHRCTTPAHGFLDGLRTLCTTHGIPLIFDEVETGFRLAYGGAQEYYNVKADLVAYGKALGGGFPLGAYGGRKEIMQVVEDRWRGSDQPYAWTASDQGGNGVSCAAARASLAILRDRELPTYKALMLRGEYFRESLQTILNHYRLEAHVIGEGSLARIVWTQSPSLDYRARSLAEAARSKEFLEAIFRRGILVNPSNTHSTQFYLSMSHDKDILDFALDVIDEAAAELAGTLSNSDGTPQREKEFDPTSPKKLRSQQDVTSKMEEAEAALDEKIREARKAGRRAQWRFAAKKVVTDASSLVSTVWSALNATAGELAKRRQKKADKNE